MHDLLCAVKLVRAVCFAWVEMNIIFCFLHDRIDTSLPHEGTPDEHGEEGHKGSGWRGDLPSLHSHTNIRLSLSESISVNLCKQGLRHV